MKTPANLNPKREPKGVKAVRSSDVLGIVRELLKLQRKSDKWRDKIESCRLIEIREPISGDWMLLHLALDALGVPKEELECKTENGPIFTFCRDAIVDEYLEMVGKRNDIAGYIKRVQKYVRTLSMPNGQKLSHAAGDIRQPETRSGNGQA